MEEFGTPKKKHSFMRGFFTGLCSMLLVVLLAGGISYVVFFAGDNSSEKIEIQSEENRDGNSVQNSVESTTASKDDGDGLVDDGVIRKIQILAETIDDYYYLEPKTDEELQNGLYKGLLEALGDPYSQYYTAEEFDEMMSSSEGVYYGIGAYISLDALTNLPKISGVIENTPAEEAGLRAEDIIYEIDGESVHGLSLTEVVTRIKGDEGTVVELTIVRDGESDYLYFPVTRAKVETPTVKYEMYPGRLAYIQITEFDDITATQFKDALEQAKTDGMEGLIIDLRSNPGGNLSTVVSIAQQILPRGMIVYTEDKNGKRTEYSSTGENQLDVPLVTLIDGNSASASEILAGAIKDYGIGTLVGTTSYGKGIVQQIIPFTDGSAVKVTVSSYFTPKGNNIHGIGIEPDVVCEFDSETYYSDEEHYDNQLEKAKDVLREKIKKQK